MAHKQQILEIVRTSVEAIKTDVETDVETDGQTSKMRFMEVVDPEKIKEFNKIFGEMPAIRTSEMIPSDLPIAVHTKKYADFLVSLKLPEDSLTGEHTITFYYQNKNVDSFAELFKLTIRPGQEYQLNDPLPLLLIPYTKIWFTGSKELEITYVRIVCHELRKKLTDQEIEKTKTHDGNHNLYDQWQFLSGDCAKYITYYAALFPSDNF